MIIRWWLILGFVLTAVAWILQVPLAPEPFQATARSAIDGYRKAGLMPPAGTTKLSKEVGHDVFEIPESDARHAKEEAAAMGGMSMPGMKKGAMKDGKGIAEMKPMPGMKKGAMKNGKGMAEMKPMPGMKKGAMKDGKGMAEMKPMPGMKKGAMKDGKGKAEMKPMPGMKKGAMKDGKGMAEMKPMPGMKKGAMKGGKGMAEMKPMPGMKKDAKKDGEAHGKEPVEGHGGGGKAVGITLLAQGSRSEVAKALGSTKITRTVNIEMREWGFRPGRIDVKPGETIRFIVRNAGQTPHEFMFMNMAGMRAVNYRIERADWNLLEHEAIVEQSIVMPGDSFEQVIRIEKPGVWMFMCMFPYHMRFGMMGAMLTPGMTMMSMPGMKMGGGMGGMKGMSGMKKGGEMKPMPGMSGMKKGGEMKPMPGMSGMKKNGEMKPMKGMKKTDH